LYTDALIHMRCAAAVPIRCIHSCYVHTLETDSQMNMACWQYCMHVGNKHLLQPHAICMTVCIAKTLTFAACSHSLDKSETKEWPHLGCALEFASAQTPHMVMSHTLLLLLWFLHQCQLLTYPPEVRKPGPSPQAFLSLDSK